MATPSLAMIPSAYADSKVYSVLPNNGDGDFTFNRDSSATRVGQNGLIQEVGFFGNELVTNGDFATDSDWTKGTGWTISGGKANSDGSQSSQSNLVQSGIVPINKTYKATFTVVVTSGSIVLAIGGSNAQPTVSSSGTYTFTSKATSGDSSLYFSALTNFIGSIDNVSVQEVTGDQPRLNYDISNGQVQSCPSLLLEPASTNVINYSEDFSNSAWTKNNTTVASGFTSPDGTNNAYLMTDDATDSKHGVYKLDVLSQDGNIYTRSVFVKKGTARYIVLSARHLPTSSGTGWIYDFNINNWVLTGSTGVGQSIENYGNGWYRLSISHISNSNFNNDFSIGISSGATIPDASYSGVGDTVHIWGTQVELGSYPTSYIPTNGASQTRAAETCFGAGTSSTFNDSEGVLYAEISALVNPTSQEVALCISEGQSGANRLLIRIKTNGAIGIVLRVANTTEATIDSGVLNQLSSHKVAVKWKVNDIALWIDGVEVGTDNSANVFSANTLDEVSFNQGNNSNQFYGNTRDIRVFNEALTDAQLQTLTTL